jgi:hypothetical protein
VKYYVLRSKTGEVMHTMLDKDFKVGSLVWLKSNPKKSWYILDIYYKDSENVVGLH